MFGSGIGGDLPGVTKAQLFVVADASTIWGSPDPPEGSEDQAGPTVGAASPQAAQAVEQLFRRSGHGHVGGAAESGDGWRPAPTVI